MSGNAHVTMHMHMYGKEHRFIDDVKQEGGGGGGGGSKKKTSYDVIMYMNRFMSLIFHELRSKN